MEKAYEYTRLVPNADARAYTVLAKRGRTGMQVLCQTWTHGLSLKYNNDDQFITGFLDKYCINQEWYHPSGNDQELILNDSNTISECEILAYLIINN